MLDGATWIGDRRWDIRFRSGETLSLPEGDGAARDALVDFARRDGVARLLGQGIVRFDMRVPGRFVVRVKDPVPPLAIDTPKPAAPPPRRRAAAADRRRRDEQHMTGAIAGAGRAPHEGAGMAHDHNGKLITALDIGSSKVCALIALAPEEGGELQVLGTGQRESKGVRRGYIADMERTEARDPRGGGAGRAHRPAPISRMSGSASRPAGWSRRSPRSRSISAATASSSATSTICSPPGAARSIPRGGWCCTRSRRSTRSTA